MAGLPAEPAEKTVTARLYINKAYFLFKDHLFYCFCSAYENQRPAFCKHCPEQYICITNSNSFY